MTYVKMAFYNGATQLSKKAICLTTLSIMRLSLRAGTTILLSVKILNVVMLSVVMVSVFMLIVNLLSVC
jgi:hypothetical protein